MIKEIEIDDIIANLSLGTNYELNDYESDIIIEALEYYKEKNFK